MAGSFLKALENLFFIFPPFFLGVSCISCTIGSPATSKEICFLPSLANLARSQRTLSGFLVATNWCLGDDLSFLVTFRERRASFPAKPRDLSVAVW